MNRFTLALLIFISQGTSLFALLRDYDHEDGGWYMDYCIDHCHLPKHTYEIRPYLSLIPTQSEKQCKNVNCSVCDTVWVADGIILNNTSYHSNDDDIDHEEPLEDPYWMCECKEEEFDEMLENASHYLCLCGSDCCTCDCDITCRYNWNLSWTRCKNFAVYGGYFSENHIKYFRFLKTHLEYVNQNKSCDCYWPEKSEYAAKMNDVAYKKIATLLERSPISKLMEDETLQQKIHGASEFYNFNIRLNTHETARALTCQCFLYSDHDQVLEELDFVSRNHLDSKDYAQVKAQIELIRTQLCSNYIKLNQKCYEKHPNPRIEREIKFINSLLSLNKITPTDQATFR